MPKSVDLYSDKDEWAAWSNRGDPVLHIELAKWADIFLIAPLDANTLAKIANVRNLKTEILKNNFLQKQNVIQMKHSSFIKQL